MYSQKYIYLIWLLQLIFNLDNSMIVFRYPSFRSDLGFFLDSAGFVHPAEHVATWVLAREVRPRNRTPCSSDRSTHLNSPIRWLWTVSPPIKQQFMHSRASQQISTLKVTLVAELSAGTWRDEISRLDSSSFRVIPSIANHSAAALDISIMIFAAIIGNFIPDPFFGSIDCVWAAYAGRAGDG